MDMLRSCIQGAVGMLRDQDGRQRSVRRVEVLLSLLDDDDQVKGTEPRGRHPGARPSPLRSPGHVEAAGAAGTPAHFLIPTRDPGAAGRPLLGARG